MIIQECLPFDVCQHCDMFVLKANEETIFVGGNTQRVINITCKHSRKCEILNDNLADMKDEKENEQ